MKRTSLVLCFSRFVRHAHPFASHHRMRSIPPALYGRAGQARTPLRTASVRSSARTFVYTQSLASFTYFFLHCNAALSSLLVRAENRRTDFFCFTYLVKPKNRVGASTNPSILPPAKSLNQFRQGRYYYCCLSHQPQVKLEIVGMVCTNKAQFPMVRLHVLFFSIRKNLRTGVENEAQPNLSIAH